MKKILFICLGNICRSTAAEEVMRTLTKRAGLELEIDSAGLINYHEGELADPRMRNHAFRHGYRLTHRSRPVKAEDFYRFDHIFAMDHNNVRGLQRVAPAEELMQKVEMLPSYLTRHQSSTIPDPYYGDDKDFEYVIELLEDACENLVSKFQSE